MATALVTLLLLSPLILLHAQSPATIDVSSTYRLTNNYTGLGKAFAARNDGSGQLEMAATADSPLQYWRFVLLQTGPTQYALRTVYYGDSFSLDVLNDQGVNSTSVQLSATGHYSGQYWTITPWGDGTYPFSNSFTGPTKHLDVFSNTFQPTLSLDYGGSRYPTTIIWIAR